MSELIVVSSSGGKDSTACILLALEKGRENCRFVFADTGNEHPATVEYITQTLPKALDITVDVVRADFSREVVAKRKYIEEHWAEKGVTDELVQSAINAMVPTGVPFLDLCLWKNRFPSRMAQFCTQFLKRIPLDEYIMDRLDEADVVESWRGIRKDESQSRAKSVSRELTAEGYWIVHPILDWTAQQTVDFVRSRGVPLNPLYSSGMGRVGCLPCINCTKDELLEISKRFPEHIDRIREWERIVSSASKRGMTTFFTEKLKEGETEEQLLSRLGIDARVRWARTARGGTQFDAFRDEEGPMCSSMYGLCE